MGSRALDPRDVAVGQQVKQLRLKAGLSQVQVAKAMGISFQQVQKYENGKNRIAASRLGLLAEILQVEVSAFFVNSDRNQPDTPQRVRIMELIKDINDTRVETDICQLLESIQTGR